MSSVSQQTLGVNRTTVDSPLRVRENHNKMHRGTRVRKRSRYFSNGRTRCHHVIEDDAVDPIQSSPRAQTARKVALAFTNGKGALVVTHAVRHELAGQPDP